MVLATGGITISHLCDGYDGPGVVHSEFTGHYWRHLPRPWTDDSGFDAEIRNQGDEALCPTTCVDGKGNWNQFVWGNVRNK